MILRKSGNREGITNQYRLVTDFRRLNALTKSSTYVPLSPLIRTIIKQLSSAKIFSASDVVGGFYQQTLAEEDRDKTTFVCHTAKGERKFCFRVSCLGLTGAPAAYQLHMEDVLQGIHGDGVMIYIDDFLYYSETVDSTWILWPECLKDC